METHAFEFERGRQNFRKRRWLHYRREMTETIDKGERFSDAGELTYEFGDEFFVVCPKCAGKAKVFALENDSEQLREKLFAPRKLVCLSCPFRADWNGGQLNIGGNFDWYFRLPLWLQISCCGGKTLWAYNESHLEFIENYVAARLRERVPNVNKSLASRLPQ
jgi:hypothetical protein